MVRVALLFVVLVLVASPVRGRDQRGLPLGYEEALATYRGGNVRAAVQSLATIQESELEQTAERLWLRGDQLPAAWLGRVRTSIALFTETSILHTPGVSAVSQDPYLAAARLLARRLARLAAERRDGAGDAEHEFARNWYLLVASFWHGRAEVGWSRAYLVEARQLFPGDSAVLLVSGSDHEMISHLTAGFLRRFNADGRTLGESRIDPGDELDQAEKFLRQALALSPGLVEARLRLGRILYRRGDLDGAERELRAVLASTAYDQVRYLAWIFLGQVQVERGNLPAAEGLYKEALRLFPGAQAATVALSEAEYLAGRSAAAAAEIVSLLKVAGPGDPWWMYLLGDWWHFDARVTAMRAGAMR